MGVTSVIDGDPQGNVGFPTRQYELFGGVVHVCAFGGPMDFARPLENSPALDAIVRQAHVYGITDVFMPDVTDSSARMVWADLKFTPWRQNLVAGVNFFHDNRADGVWLTKPSAFFVASGDCPTFIARLPDGTIAVAHASRDSLMDRAVIDVKDVVHRDYESVVMAALAGWTDEREITQTALLCGIGAKSFGHPYDHPEYGQRNRKMIEHLLCRWGAETVLNPHELGQISLCGIVRAQLTRLGALTEKQSFVTDGIDTFTDTICDAPRAYRWHSHRRGDRGRNGILVFRLK